jgi:hypothetical protein
MRGSFHKQVWIFLAALVCAAGVWLYVYRVMIPHQITEAAARGLPRGNLTDLYPPWLAARELIEHGRDPYSPEVTREIQQGYYGRSLDPERPGEPRDQQGFAYPAYVAFYFAPTLYLRFDSVRKAGFCVLLCLTAAAILLWLWVLRWSCPLWAKVSLIAFAIGSLTVVQGLTLRQMTLLVFALLTIAIALLASHRPIGAGIALALSTIKPQLVWLLLLWLVIWTIADWRRRYRCLASFLLTMAILCVAAEWYLPHWIPRFLQAMRRYLYYTDAVSTLEKVLPWPWGWLMTALAVAATIHIAWKNRRLGEDTAEFNTTVSLTLAVTIIVIPSYALYNQVLLMPSLLVLVFKRQQIWNRNRMSRVLLSLALILLLWERVTSLVLAGLSFVLPSGTVEAAWAVPLWTFPFSPAIIAALMLVYAYQTIFTATARAGRS